MRLQKILSIALITAPLGLMPGFASSSFGQEAETAAKVGEDASKGEDSQEEPEELSVPDQIRALLKERKPGDAAAMLESALKTSDDVAELKKLHRSIAIGFMQRRETEKALKQLSQAFEYEFKLADSPATAASLAGLVQQINVYGSMAKQQDMVAELSNKAIEKCRELESEYPIKIQPTLAALVGMKARTVSRNDEDAARKMLLTQVTKLEQINAGDEATEATASALIGLLTTQASLFDGADEKQAVEAAFEQALKTYPDSEVLMGQYASHEYSMVSRLYRDNPEEASKRMEAAIAKLTPYSEMRMVASGLRRFKPLESRIEAARKQLSLIGKPAPPLEIDSWTNTDGISVEDLKGKVVMYDFWAIWCGPCIATFPHLREFREEFGDQGFEIVGITRYYGYKWDEENGKAVRGEADPEVEQEAVANFLQSKDMQHPTIITPKVTDLQANYAVTGIPHAVLVDRNGIIRMIKVGSGQANADALHEKIAELVAE